MLSLTANIAEALAWFSSEPAFLNRQRVIDIRQTSWVASPDSFFDSHKFQPKYNLAKGLQETIDWGKKNNGL
jgi:nucleoside-diphosphate-sugar epimerase